MCKMHVDPLDGLIDEVDNQKFIGYLKSTLVELGTQAKGYREMRFCDRVALYAKLSDCISSLLLIYCTTRKAEVEGMTVHNWRSGIQSDPVNRKLLSLNFYFAEF